MYYLSTWALGAKRHPANEKKSINWIINNPQQPSRLVRNPLPSAWFPVLVRAHHFAHRLSGLSSPRTPTTMAEIETQNETEFVKLKSKQEEVFEVEAKAAFRSITVKNMVDDTGFQIHVPVPMVDSSTLVKVIEYLKYHQKAEEDGTEDTTVWDVNYVKVDDETLFNLILAANYLDIKSLLDLTCKAVADEIKGKTPEEIRTRFNIKNDFTPEEEEEVKRENAWCEER